MMYIFIDTNSLLHFIGFEPINWIDVLNKNDDVTIVLAPTVVDELDKHKYNSIKKIAKRAKKVLPQIESLIEDTIAGHDFEEWLEGLPENVRKEIQNKGFELCKTMLSFTRYIMEKNDVGIAEFIKQKMGSEDYAEYQYLIKNNTSVG